MQFYLKDISNCEVFDNFLKNIKISSNNTGVEVLDFEVFLVFIKCYFKLRKVHTDQTLICMEYR